MTNTTSDATTSIEEDTEDELRALIEGAATTLSENGFNVRDTDVERLSGEVWAFIWLSGTGGEPHDSRQEDAKHLLKTHVEAADTDLPTSVNMSYGKAGDSAVAVWI